ncbi:hypothetical protein [Caulobacter vibrioides]|uniref:hypothetical protein n=1 Tax=Caulobacter vibrioides TaxID=155892 RepID=UPI000BB4B5D9|nr:hypothetical protein [Caulobacter vibrioides]ATC23819.1 hypothetical protein CA608_04360 [Caulobacter vibrioides]PLR15971.1 hypothetical protein CVUC_02445 [Caulobacter vibrioides]
MVKSFLGAGLAGVMIFLSPTTSLADDKPKEIYAKGEASLLKELNGRVAGQPVPCITRRLVVETRVIDRTALLFRMPDGTMFVNRPINGTRWLQHDGVVGQIGAIPTAICQNDVAVVYDPGGKGYRRPGASAQLGPFIPYFER